MSITPPHIKLEQLLKLSRACTGGEAKQLIQSGKVTLNGAVCLERGKKVRIGDSVTLDDYNISVTEKQI
ncbi:MAG: RNA-binding S4 domain-containing protein [Oscillospiraceae bacterium]|nr:RNA-binding S4 domain-containing protein [Oscillospiraceae bacterium]